MPNWEEWYNRSPIKLTGPTAAQLYHARLRRSLQLMSQHSDEIDYFRMWQCQRDKSVQGFFSIIDQNEIQYRK